MRDSGHAGQAVPDTDVLEFATRDYRGGDAEIGATSSGCMRNAIDAVMDSLKTQEGRKVVLVFSDGGDSPGNFRMNNRGIGRR
jgi:hypothetical protein